MAIKTGICIICGEEVTNRQSNFIPEKNGRACKKHEETLAAVESIRTSIKTGLDQHRQAHHKFRDNVSAALTIRDPKTYCWHCEKSGMEERDYFARMLVLMPKMELKNISFNPFIPSEEAREFIKNDIKVETIIKGFPADHLKSWQVKQLIKNTSLKELVERKLIEIVILCPDCAKQFSFDWSYNLPEISPDQLQSFAIISGLCSDEFKKMAETEISMEDK